MTRLIDRVGVRYGRLVVIKRIIKEDEHGRSRWECQCDCGNTVIVLGANLTAGTRSCGCLRKEKQRLSVTKSPGDASFNSLYRDYARDAGKRGLAFSLSKNEFRVITSSPCHYCGEPPTKEWRSNGCSTSYFGNGVDRKDNNRGYAIDNCVSCCWPCNYMKRGINYQDFIDRVKAIAHHLEQ